MQYLTCSGKEYRQDKHRTAHLVAPGAFISKSTLGEPLSPKHPKGPKLLRLKVEEPRTSVSHKKVESP